MEKDETDAGQASLSFDSSLYDRDVVLRALYWLSDRAFTLLDQEKSRYLVYIRPKDATRQDARSLEAEFSARLVDEVLRQQIRTETTSIREIIFAKAFAASGFLDDPLLQDDRDPVEIKRSGQP